jgi:hypothetical protein
MIPANTFTTVPEVSQFITPYNDQYFPLSQNVLGGVAVGDPSLGRQVKVWNVSYNGTFINVKPNDGPVAFSLAATDVKTVSLAFDNNMGLVITWTTTGGANLYYYDTLTSAYITRNFPGIASCRVCVDDARDFYLASSDVIFSYTLGGSLYWRQQRDRYDVQYLIGVTTKTLIRAAPNVGNRLQFELV